MYACVVQNALSIRMFGIREFILLLFLWEVEDNISWFHSEKMFGIKRKIKKRKKKIAISGY